MYGPSVCLAVGLVGGVHGVLVVRPGCHLQRDASLYSAARGFRHGPSRYMRVVDRRFRRFKRALWCLLWCGTECALRQLNGCCCISFVCTFAFTRRHTQAATVGTRSGVWAPQAPFFRGQAWRAAGWSMPLPRRAPYTYKLNHFSGRGRTRRDRRPLDLGSIGL